MSTSDFANTTSSVCTTPLLDKSLFSNTGGYQAGRYCGLGSFESGANEASCCFPCPMQDWVYSSGWEERLRIPNYLSVFSIFLCSFLLLSFIILPPAQSHRHYLNIGLLIPVLLIALSFAIPVSQKPQYCYDAITPSSMHGSMACAWTGSLVTLGGLGCVIWVFLRSLWLFIRIVYDIAPGRKFMLWSIATGTLLPIAFLVAVLAKTGYSYRMGSTCLPNHKNAIRTFWVWLVMFAILGFLLQVFTTIYCSFVYVKTLKKERFVRSHTEGYGQNQNHQADLKTWRNIKKLFLLQWRNILVSVFVLIGSLVFFVVFWTQDSRLGKVFNSSIDIKPVKTWITCQILSKDNKSECRKHVKGFTMEEPAVLSALILASLMGIELFILLFRASMLCAWMDLFKRIFYRTGLHQLPTPELTSLDSPQMYSLTSPKLRKSGSRFIEGLDAPESSTGSTNHTKNDSQSSYASTQYLAVPNPPPPSLTASMFTTSTPPPIPPRRSASRPYRPLPPLPLHVRSASVPSTLSSLKRIPTLPTIQITSPSPHVTTVCFSPTKDKSLPIPPKKSKSPPAPPVPRSETYHRLSVSWAYQPTLSTRTYQPTRPAPLPPRHRNKPSQSSSLSDEPLTPTSVFNWGSCGTRGAGRSWRDSTISALDKVIKNSGNEEAVYVKLESRGGLQISAPVKGSFKHVDGAFVSGERWEDRNGNEDEDESIGRAA